MAYDHKCKYELTEEERSLLTCATGLLYKKYHYRNYLFLPVGDVDNLIKLGLVQERNKKELFNNYDEPHCYYFLTEEGIRTAYEINGLKVPKKIDMDV